MQSDELLRKFGVQSLTGIPGVAKEADSHDYQNRNEATLPGEDVIGQSFGPQLGDADLDRDQVGDMISASEARTETKFARLEGKLDLILQQFKSSHESAAAEREHVRRELTEIRSDNRNTKTAVVGTVLATGLGVVLFVVAALTLYVNALSTGAALAPSHEPVAVISAPVSNKADAQPEPKMLPAPTQNKS